MLFFWNRREIYFGNNVQKYVQICQVLAQNGIRYTTRYKNSSSSYGMHRGHSGINTELTALYYIYVHKDNLEHAEFLVYKFR